MTAVLRVHQVVRTAGLSVAAHETPERTGHSINEVWALGDHIIRINPVPGAHRLQDEARLLLYLPAAAHAPVPVAAGAAPWGEWAVTMRLPGCALAQIWGALGEAGRRRAITDVGLALEALHRVVAPTQIPPGDPDRCPHPLPVPRILRLLADAADLPGADRKVFGDAAERLVDLADYLDPVDTTLIHGDLHLENVLATADGSVTGVLDFEWARPGPPDLDLDVLLQSLANPSLHHDVGAGERLHRGDFDAAVGWLRDAYPALFSRPHLHQRLWVYRLAYDVRDLLAHPPRAGTSLAGTPPYHPYRRIIRHVEGGGVLSWFPSG
ncbi:MAG: hypothetical protein NVS1B12_01290 [Acidimicrobiales bacterium]